MNSSKYRFTLDMHVAQSQVSLPIVLHDTKRKLYVSLADGGKLYHIADGCLAVIRIDRPTGTYIEQFCPIEDNTNIVFDFEQHTNTAIVEGLHECEVTLYGLDGGVLTTARFSMVVSARVVNSDDIEITEDDWTLIDSVAVEEAKRQETFSQTMEDVKEAIASIDEAIDEIVPPTIGENGNWFVRGEDTGVQAQGIQGEKGDKGDKGEKGDKGDRGEKGADGTGVSILGSYASETELRAAHPTGEVGDAYMVAGSLYIWSETEKDWINAGSIKGEAGADGKTPVNGTDYYTEADKAEMVELVLAALPTWNGGEY
ncbi:MAG: collagen-like protein [Eubacteriales bacterium]